jgi:hypothetical protein
MDYRITTEAAPPSQCGLEDCRRRGPECDKLQQGAGLEMTLKEEV